MAGGPTFDQERIHINLVRLKKGGENFEVVVDPDLAVEFKELQKEDKASVSALLKAEKVFSDAKKGLLASEEHMKELFGSSEPIDIALILLQEGDIQITQQHREKLREEKLRKIINLIHINGIDPKTGIPHPETRIQLAFDEAKIRIDEFKKAEDQVQDIVKKISTVIPIRFEKNKIRITLPAEFAPKLYATIQRFATIRKDVWLNDGSWQGDIELPAGLKTELMDELNNKTHGNVSIKTIK